MRPLLRLLAAVLPCLALSAAGQAQGFAIGAHGGTQGLGVSLSAGFTETVHGRLVGGQYTTDRTVSTSGVDYEGDFRLGSVLALLDWYPTGGGFRVSGGFGWNGNEAKVTAPLEQLARDQVPNLPPLSFDLGTAEGIAKGEELVPALLLGWGNPFLGSRVGLSLDLGVLYQGEPAVELEAMTSPEVDAIPGARAILQALADAEETELEEELSDYSLIPVVSLSLSFRF